MGFSPPKNVRQRKDTQDRILPFASLSTSHLYSPDGITIILKKKMKRDKIRQRHGTFRPQIEHANFMFIAPVMLPVLLPL